jgi:hypothetical protein
VISQTYNCEVVVDDDGSADDSLVILESYEPAITVVKIFTKNPTVGWIMHNMATVTHDGSAISDRMYRLTESDHLLHDILLKGDTPGSTSGRCFRRSMLEHIGPIPGETFNIEPDGFLICSAIFLGAGRTLDESLTIQRVHAAQASRRRRPDRIRSLHAISIKRGISDCAAELAEKLDSFPGRKSLTEKKTWWQAKAELQYHKTRPELSRFQIAQSWLTFVRATAFSSLGLSRKLALVARDTMLVTLTRTSYPTAWWVLHYGRPHLRRKK